MKSNGNVKIVNSKFLYMFVLLVFFTSGLKVASQSVGVSAFDLYSSLLFVILYFVIYSKGIVIDRVLLIPLFLVSTLPILSCVLNFENFSLIKIFYAIRFIEYALWFFLGLFLSSRMLDDAIKLSIVIAFLLFFLSPYIGGIGKYGFFNYIWELSAFASISTIYIFVYFPHSRAKYILLFMALVLALSTGQRTPIAATLLCLAIYAFYSKSVSSKVKFTALSLLIMSTVTVSITENRLSKTFLDVFNSGNYEAIYLIYESASRNHESYSEFVHSSRTLVGDEGDLSLQLRLKKWMFASAEMFNKPASVIYGLGPGYFSGAADSSIVRVFFEYGLIGLFFWFLLFYRFSRVNSGSFYLVSVFVLNAVFIDTLYSSRIMVMFLLVIGCLYGEEKLRKKEW